MSFEPVIQRAVTRHGSYEIIKAAWPEPLSDQALGDLPDSFFLAQMTKRIFQAGFVWAVIESKWKGFEAAFGGFDPLRFSVLPEESLRPMVNDKRIIRNWQKIQTVKPNSDMIIAQSEKYGSFGKFLAQWPVNDIVSLWAFLKKNGARLGGNTGPMFLRFSGKDTFILSNDVVQALIQEGVVTKQPTSVADLKKVQDQFNQWQAETGLHLCQLSKTLAMSVG
ncbi:MAG: DNA-3-methyladenine glycosylase I [Acidobacteria bacterium]|nr:DNA-3-methyladenine glycosylase I [Acidobacteriota bacterium]